LQGTYAEAQSRFDIGDLQFVVSVAEKTRSRIENTDPFWKWKFRLLEAEAFLWEGRPAEALSVLDPPPSIHPFPDFAVRRTLIQGRALYTQSKFARAKSCLAQAQRLALLTAPELLGDIALARAGWFHKQNRDAEAELELGKASAFADKLKNQMLQAKILGTFGQVFTAEGYYDRALDKSAQALSISQSLRARHIEAGVRLNMGWSYLELGDFDQAIPFFKVSESLAAQSGLERMRQESLNSLGRISFNQGQHEEADDYYNRALAVAKNLNDEASIALYLDNLALVSLSLGHLDEADMYNQNAVKIQRGIHDRKEELRSLRTTASIADARKEFARAKSILGSILADKDTLTSVRWEAEHELATLYIQTGKTAQAEAAFKRGSAILNRSWASIREDGHKLAFSSWAVDFYDDYVRFLVNQGKCVRALQVAESIRGRTLEEVLKTRKTSSPGLLRLPSVEMSLQLHRQVILAYWLSAKKSYLWVITPSDVNLLLLPPKQEIEEKVERYQNLVTKLGDPLRGDHAGRDLYRILVEPARKLIPAQAQVVIIPDGNLGKVNFETLIVPEPSPHFWIDDVQLEDASSIALLVQSRASVHTHRKLLAIGDPVQVTDDYKPLVYAQQEIDAAAQHFPVPEGKIISGPAATPSSYASNTPGQFDIIHFATHGFASVESPLDSAIILSPQADKSFKLYARDIVKIPLKADLVTISACYGAGKRTYSSEGLVGLAWAFLRAGAHQVIAGLWNVEDRSTPELMKTLYSEVANGTNVAVALRDAKLKMLHSTGVYRLPYYWAALQLYTGS